MSEPDRPHLVPGPPAGEASEAAAALRFEDLDERAVAEHVDVFEAEHARLERELRTIDQL